MGDARIEAWLDWRDKGLYPYPGGYAAQPLSLLVHMKSIELVYSTVKYMYVDGGDWLKLNRTQADLVRELE